MSKKPMPKFVYAILLLVVGVGVYLLIANLANQAETPLTASGTIEAVSAVISPEISGKVAEVAVNEGDEVASGDTLFVLDGTLLQAQREIAAANLALANGAQATALAGAATAQTNYDLVLAAARQESAAQRAAEWQTANPEGYTLPDGTFTQQELIAAAQAEVDDAKSALTDAENELNDLLTEDASASFVKAEKALLALKFEAQSTKDVLTKAQTSGNSDLEDSAQDLYDDTLDRLEDAQRKYDNLLDTDAAEKILIARNDLVLAVERVQAAETRLASLQTGENSLKVQAARAALAQAQAAADQAGQAVSQAEANLALLDVQITKLTVLAPSAGIVLTRSIELGEVVSTGSSAISLGQLDPLTITVYVPESEIGQLSIGQNAGLVVDSFPDEVFTASIIHIADEAEFTPRNVQTVDSRKTTVFAVKLQMENPDGRLKPGMPADVTFQN